MKEEVKETEKRERENVGHLESFSHFRNYPLGRSWRLSTNFDNNKGLSAALAPEKQES